MSNKIVDLAVMHIKGTLPAQFSNGEVSPNEALRAGFNEILGLDEGQTTFNPKVFRAHKYEIFSILEEILQKVDYIGSLGELENLVEERNLAHGDTNVFKVPDNELFRVSVVSEGNGNLRRQRLREGQEFAVKTHVYGVKIYEEFVRFQAGRIDFLDMIDKVKKSFERALKEEIYHAILDTFRSGGSGSPYRVTISGGQGVQEEKILEVAKHLEAKTGQKPVVVGSALALYKANPKYMSEANKGEANKQGFTTRIAGLDVIELPPMHKKGTDEFMLEDNELFILPQTGDKFIKVVNEGEAYIRDNSESVRDDLQIEYLMTQKFGISVIASSEYGYIKFA